MIHHVTAALQTGRVVLPDPYSGMLDALLVYVATRREQGENHGTLGTNVPQASPFSIPVRIDSDDNTGTWWFRATAPLRSVPVNVVTETKFGRQEPYTWTQYTPTAGRTKTGGGRYRQTMKPVRVALTQRLDWFVDTDNPDMLFDMVSEITHVGGHRQAGFGVVSRWDIAPIDDRSVDLYIDGLPGPTRPVPYEWALTRGFETLPSTLPLVPPYHPVKGRPGDTIASRW